MTTISYERAMLALVLNFFVLPGFGTVVGKQKKKGFVQMGLMVLAFIILFTSVFFEIFFANGVTSTDIVTALILICIIGVWIWGIVSGINMVRQAKKFSEDKTDVADAAERGRN